ncbi:hypothetical protein [Cupriavidus sp. 8B]
MVLAARPAKAVAQSHMRQRLSIGAAQQQLEAALFAVRKTAPGDAASGISIDLAQTFMHPRASLGQVPAKQSVSPGISNSCSNR